MTPKKVAGGSTKNGPFRAEALVAVRSGSVSDLEPEWVSGRCVSGVSGVWVLPCMPATSSCSLAPYVLYVCFCVRCVVV